MRTGQKYAVFLAALLVTFPGTEIASAKNTEQPNILETLEVRPLTRSSTDVYDVLTQLIQARDHYAAREFERSYRAYKYTALHDRNNIEAALGTANSALEIGRTKEALAIFKNLSAAGLKAETRLAVQTGIVLADYFSGQMEGSETRLKTALDRTPGDTRLWNALGHFYQGQKRWQAAALAYERAHKEGYSRAGLYNNFGTLLVAQSRFEMAVRYFEQAAKMEPGKPDFENNYRLALLLDGQFGPAMEALTDTEAAKLLTRSGQIAMEKKTPDLAILLLTKAVEISPVYNARAEAGLKKLQQAAK